MGCSHGACGTSILSNRSKPYKIENKSILTSLIVVVEDPTRKGKILKELAYEQKSNANKQIGLTANTSANMANIHQPLSKINTNTLNNTQNIQLTNRSNSLGLKQRMESIVDIMNEVFFQSNEENDQEQQKIDACFNSLYDEKADKFRYYLFRLMNIEMENVQHPYCGKLWVLYIDNTPHDWDQIVNGNAKLDLSKAAELGKSLRLVWKYQKFPKLTDSMLLISHKLSQTSNLDYIEKRLNGLQNSPLVEEIQCKQDDSFYNSKQVQQNIFNNSQIYSNFQFRPDILNTQPQDISNQLIIPSSTNGNQMQYHLQSCTKDTNVSLHIQTEQDLNKKYPDKKQEGISLSNICFDSYENVLDIHQSKSKCNATNEYDKQIAQQIDLIVKKQNKTNLNNLYYKNLYQNSNKIDLGDGDYYNLPLPIQKDNTIDNNSKIKKNHTCLADSSIQLYTEEDHRQIQPPMHTEVGATENIDSEIAAQTLFENVQKENCLAIPEVVLEENVIPQYQLKIIHLPENLLEKEGEENVISERISTERVQHRQPKLPLKELLGSNGIGFDEFSPKYALNKV